MKDKVRRLSAKRTAPFPYKVAQGYCLVAETSLAYTRVRLKVYLT